LGPHTRTNENIYVQGEQITIAGLFGSSTVSGKLNLVITSSIFNQRFEWFQEKGMAVLTITSNQILSSLKRTQFSFILSTNLNSRPGIFPTIGANSGGLWNQALRNLTIFPSGCVEIPFESVIVSQFNSSLFPCDFPTFQDLTSAVILTPMCVVDQVEGETFYCKDESSSICLPCNASASCCSPCSILGSTVDPYFMDLKVSSSSNVSGAQTLVTMQIASVFDLAEEALLFLDFSDTNNVTDIVPLEFSTQLSGPDALNFELSPNTTGNRLLKLKIISPYGLIRGRVATVSWRMTNPVSYQAGQVVKIFTNASTEFYVNLPLTVFDGYVFNVQAPPVLLVKSISSSSDIEGATAYITVSIISNALLSSDNSITISGLTQSISVSTTNFPIYRIICSGTISNSFIDSTRKIVYLGANITSATGNVLDFVGSWFLAFSIHGSDLGMHKIVSFETGTGGIKFELPFPNTVPEYNPATYKIISLRDYIVNSEWTRDKGTLTFQLQAPLVEFSALHILFSLQNDRVLKSGVNPVIMVGGTPIFAQALMDNDGSVLRVSTAAQRLGFNIKEISSSSQVIGGLNTISVSLQSTYDIPGCRPDNSTIPCLIFSITGLVPFATPDQTVTLGGAEADWFVNSTAMWVRQTGSLALILQKRIPPGVLVRFNFLLRNSFSTISSPIKAMISIAGQLNSTSSIINGSVSGVTLNPSFLTLDVTTTSDVAGSLNTMYFSFRTNTEIEPSSVLILSGLLGSLTPDAVITIGGPHASAFGYTGAWFQSNGTVLLNVLVYLSHAEFSLQVRNGLLENISCSQACLSSGNASSYDCTCNISRPTAIVGAEIIGSWRIAKTNVGNYSFTAKTQPSFVQATVFGSSSVAGALNNITVSLIPNFEIVQSSTIYMEGLMGFETPDAPCILATLKYQPCLDWRIGISSPATGIFVLYKTVWNQRKGALSVSTQEASFSPHAPFVFSFGLRNSFTFHGGLPIRIGLGGNSISFNALPLRYCQYTQCLPTDLAPSFMFIDISSSSSLYGGMTTITVYFTAFVFVYGYFIV
jgi:hypothetical protein